MIINWVRRKAKDFQDVISDMSSNIIDDMPADEIPDKFKPDAVSDTNLESTNLHKSPVRPGDHSYTHSNSY